MAKSGKSAGKVPQPEAEVRDASTAKSRVTEMFESAQPAELHINTTLEVPEHSDGEPSARVAKDAIDAILNNLGTDKFPETVIPTPKSRNNADAAAQFVMWQHIAKAAAKKEKAAKEAAESQGVFGDPEEYVPGETSLVYNTNAFTISVKKGDDTSMVDRELTTAILKEIAPSRWQELLERCKKPRKGPAQIIVSLK